MDKQPRGTILSGYRVLDLAAESGMFCAKLLADIGAAVTRIEQPGHSARIDDTDYCYLNDGKAGITLDITGGPGRDTFLRLIREADVLVETYTPGYLDTLGLGYEALSAVNPGLILASITGFGQNGPYRQFKSSDLVAQAMGGWLSVTGTPVSPLKLYGNQAYYTASLFAANGISLALLNRRDSGCGQRLDISIMDCVAATLDHVLVRYIHQGEVAGRNGSRYWNDAFRIFPCRDGYVLLSLFQNWETLVEWLASEEMVEDLADTKWRDEQVRREGIEHIAAVLERWAMSRTAGEIIEQGQLMRFPWARIVPLSELTDSPHLIERGYFTKVECGGREYQVPGSPLRMSATTGRSRDS